MNDLDQSVDVRGGSPPPARSDARHHSIPRGIGIHFDEGAPGAGAPAAASPAAGDPGGGAGSPPAGSGGASPAPGAIDWNTAPQQLRDAYQRTQTEYQQTKTKLEPWERLNAKPEDVQRSHQTYTKLHTEATALGQRLGYDAAELQQAFQEDPIATLAVLRQMAQRPTGTDKPLTRAEMEKIADAKTKEALKPFQQEREQQLDTKAETAFDGEFDRQFKTSFPTGLPDSNREAISGLAWALLLENPDGYKALRGKGDVTSVAKAFEDAKKTFLKIITDYGEHEKTRIGGAPPKVPDNGGKKKPQTIDDIISNLGNKDVPMEAVFGR